MTEINDRLADLWRFDPASLTLWLEPEGHPRYAVQLRRITSSACMLDIIFEVGAKSWATKEMLGDLVRALQELFDPQDTLCGAGRDRALDPVAYLENHRVH